MAAPPGVRSAGRRGYRYTSPAADTAASAPPDPALGPVALALDGDAVAEVLARHLPGAARVAGCLPRYVKYRPGRHCQVLYELELEDGRSGGHVATLGHLTVLRPRRAARLWSRLAASGLAERATRLHSLAAAPACHLPELGAVMQLFPLDAKLPGLVDAVSAPVMQAELGADDCAPELVRYKPGRRAVVRYRVGGHEAGCVYGKLRADGAGALQLPLGRELIASGVPTPVPLAYLPRLAMTVHGEVAGTRLAELRDDAGFGQWMEPVADALARLHSTSIALLPVYVEEHESADLQAAVETAAALLPGRRAELGALAARLIERLERLEPQACTIHGSFHDDQVVVGEAGVVLLDLDSAALGHPLLDVSHFAAYLTAAGLEDARATFLDAYARLRPVGPDVQLFEAASLLRWSSLPFRALEPAWPAAMERRLELAEERLAEYEAHAARPST